MIQSLFSVSMSRSALSSSGVFPDELFERRIGQGFFNRPVERVDFLKKLLRTHTITLSIAQPIKATDQRLVRETSGNKFASLK
jgi:hypothetical protein